MKAIILTALLPLLIFASAPALQAQVQLHLDVYTADEAGWSVTSTLISGPTEAILIDSGFYKSDASRIADRIVATGCHLKAIIITHPHDDHYMGIGTLHQRFPNTPIYMAAEAIPEFKRASGPIAEMIRRNKPAEAPESMPIPDALPATHWEIDGQSIEIMQGQGDEASTLNEFVWIPSLRAVIAGDIVFNQVHPWLATSSEQSRAAWLQSLDRLAAMNPSIVVAGHKKTGDLKDSREAIAFTAGYLKDFETAKKAAASADELIAAMKERYPDLGQAEKILPQSARRAFMGGGMDR